LSRNPQKITEPKIEQTNLKHGETWSKRDYQRRSCTPKASPKTH
jgi:hypothetical protein